MTPAERYEKLTEHLKEENPALLEAIDCYRTLDRISWKMGLLDRRDSHAGHISWWPLISLLGTFSAGKSTFINSYVGKRIQDTGNQAVDEKFTVLCYGHSEEPVTLPGLALDADPRFPFYNISEKIEEVDPGEGNRVDAYLQLKTVKAEPLRGKILIDSPGFDADSQRDAVLRITHHIIDMSDLVLVFFDARHPEPGAMRDTLEQLVGKVIDRPDASKILYILNQIDTAAGEDNPEEIIGSWQRALSQQGLYGGNFYTIYNEEAANPIADPALAERFKRKKDEDLARILGRMESVSNERAYRIAKNIEIFVDRLENEQLPKLQLALTQWRKRTVLTEVVLWGVIIALLAAAEVQYQAVSSLLKLLAGNPIAGIAAAVAAFVAVVAIHFKLRKVMARAVARRWRAEGEEDIARGVLHNSVWWHPLFSDTPRGFGRRARRQLALLREASKRIIQKLNDQFAAPSGTGEAEAPQAEQAEKAAAETASNEAAAPSAPVSER